MTLPEVLVEFVRYLHKEESIQGTIDPDDLMLEYAQEFLSQINEIEIKRTIYEVNDPNASWSLPK